VFFFKLFVTFHDFLFLKIYTLHYQAFLLLNTLDIILEFLLVKIILSISRTSFVVESFCFSLRILVVKINRYISRLHDLRKML